MTLDLFQPLSETQKERINQAMQELPPHEPGVYTMYGHHDEVLYIGKAKDLQKRITSYRYSKSRKVQRMIAHIDRIGYEICKNETDAILLENLLIRSLRPPFNEANKRPETYYFISTCRRGAKREFRLSMRQLDDYSHTYGCFKGHLKVRRGLGAMLRLLFMLQNGIKSAHYLPAQLLKNITPMRYQIRLDDSLEELVDDMLAGRSDLLLQDLITVIEHASFKDKFTHKYFTNELENLQMFYTLGPERNETMRRELDLPSALIRQDKLDDYYVLINERRN